MFKPTRKCERGQAAVMLTMGMTLMFGMVGLSMDIGWAYYTHLTAHAAAESAALAAAQAAFESGGAFTCGLRGVVCNASAVACSNPPASPPVNNMDTACLYARQNGFVTGGKQSVTMQSGVSSVPPAVPGVTASYPG